jgi:Uma2 family endonuclease
MATETEATAEDLYRVDGKAELVDGRLKIMEPTGLEPGRAGMKIVFRLHEYERRTHWGIAVPEGVSFLVDLPNRRSFGPDAAFHVGPSSGMKFVRGAPAFAVEVRSEGDYGAAAEREIASKRADYFAAGTVVVWDVDLLGDEVVRVFRDGDSERPAAVYRRREIAEAEPAVPGWRMAVDELFE